MGNLIGQAKAELRQLPLMLGKLIGGITAVLGFGMAVWIETRSSGASTGGAWFPLFAGLAGIVVFLVSDRKITRLSPAERAKPQPAQTVRNNLITWGLLLVFVVLFITGAYFLTN